MNQGRRFVRNTQDRVLGGVCSGIADYMDWDTTWVRVVAVLLLLFGVGSPVLVYVVLWIVVPSDLSVFGRAAVGPGDYQDGYDRGYQLGYQQEQPGVLGWVWGQPVNWEQVGFENGYAAGWNAAAVNNPIP